MPLILALALAAGPTAPSPRCRPNDLVVKTGGNPGDFSGMSHDGTLLVIQNRSRRACSVEGRPMIRLQDARGAALPIARNAPVGMHPGPVVRPVSIPARGRATTPLRWVSGEVYDRSRCYDAARAAVSINGATRMIPLAGHLCGPGDGKVGFDQPLLTTGQ